MSTHSLNSCTIYVPKDFKKLERFNVLIWYDENFSELGNIQTEVFHDTKVTSFSNIKITWNQMQDIFKKNNINSGTTDRLIIIKNNISLVDLGKILYWKDISSVVEDFVLSKLLAPRKIPTFTKAFLSNIQKSYNFLVKAS